MRTGLIINFNKRRQGVGTNGVCVGPLRWIVCCHVGFDEGCIGTILVSCSLFLELAGRCVFSSRQMPAKPLSLSTSAFVPTTTRQRKFERECGQLFGEVVEVLGVPRSVGQIYGILFASSQPLSFSDIVERLEISKGSASQGLQLLRTLGAIKLLSPNDGRIAGSSRDYYEPELGLRKLVSGVLQERIAPIAIVGANRIVQLRRLAEEEGAQNIFLLDRVKQLETWRKRFKTLLPVLSALLGAKKE